MAVSRADQACAEVINGLKISGLTWGVQETPYSAYVTIRKKFQKGVDTNNLAASMTQSMRADEENETLRRNLDKLNSDYNALKASHDTEKAVAQSQDAGYRTLSHNYDSLIKKFENLKLDYAAEVDNSENLAKSLHLVNQELVQKTNVIKSIPPDYLDALERLRSDKPCCRERSKREEDLETKLKSAETDLKDADLKEKALIRDHYLQVQEVQNHKVWITDLRDLLQEKDTLIKVLKNHINKMVTNRNCFDDSYSYPAELFDQIPSHSPEMANGIDKKKLKKERQRQKRLDEAQARESNDSRGGIDPAEIDPAEIDPAENNPVETAPETVTDSLSQESSASREDTAPDSTCIPYEEEKGESDDVFLLDTLSHVLGEIFTREMHGKRPSNLKFIYQPIGEMIQAISKLPPEQSINSSPELSKVLDNTPSKINMGGKFHFNLRETASTVLEIYNECSSDQLTVLRKLDRDQLFMIGGNIQKLVEAITNDHIGNDKLLRLHANESNFDWFQNEFGDGGRYLSRSCDNIKYVTLYNAGRLIAYQTLEPAAAKRGVTGSAEQVKATDQQLDSATGGVMERVNVEREEASTSNGEISSTTISSTTPWPNQ